MRRKNIFFNKYLNYSLMLVLGLFLGWLLFHRDHKTGTQGTTVKERAAEEIWTCAMHPQIRMNEPGRCPICGMELVPISKSTDGSVDPDAIHLSDEAAQLANVQTSRVSRQVPIRDVRLYGKVETDERLIQNQVAHVAGRIENLNVSVTGESVSDGQILGQVFSPELITAQQELLEAARTKADQPLIYEAAKEKLRLWKLTDDQINDIEASGKVRNTLSIVSNTTGMVISRKVNKGDYVTQGTVLFEIADLSNVWVMFDAYESDLQFMQNGQKVTFTIQAMHGNTYSGKIAFIDPVLDPVTRVARVRVEIENRSGRLKPGMFATGNISAVPDGYRNNLVIPRSSVLWTGKRSVVYVKEESHEGLSFKMREIELGPMLGDSYVVNDGLAEGEEIVTRGAFSVDAAAQLSGKPSMMNRSNDMRNDNKLTGSGNNTRDISHVTFEVSGNCEMCKERIEKAATSVNGVISAKWDITTKELHASFNSSLTSQDAIQKTIAGAGHDNGKYKAPDDVYASLPECCLYRK